MKKTIGFLSLVFCVVLRAEPAELGFVPKPIRGDENIGSASMPNIAVGNRHILKVPLLLYPKGGINLWEVKDGSGTIKPITLDAKEGKALVDGTELNPKVAIQERALKSMAWYLIRRHPNTAYTQKFLKRYFDLTLPSAMSDDEKLALNRPDTLGDFTPKIPKPGHDGGLGAGGLPFGSGRLLSTEAGEPTLEQLTSFYEDPTQWKDGVCSTKDKCTIVHATLGSMYAPAGIKKLMLHDEELSKPVAPRPAPTGALAHAESVTSKTDFETKFKQAAEPEGWVLFSAENCGPCQALKKDLEEGNKKLPAGVKLYVVETESYEWSTLSEEIQSFKGGGGFPHLIKFKKNGSSLDRTSLAPGDLSSFE